MIGRVERGWQLKTTPTHHPFHIIFPGRWRNMTSLARLVQGRCHFQQDERDKYIEFELNLIEFEITNVNILFIFKNYTRISMLGNPVLPFFLKK